MGERTDELGRQTPADAIDRIDAAIPEAEPLRPGEIMSGGHGVVRNADENVLPEGANTRSISHSTIGGWHGGGSSHAPETDDDIGTTRAQIEQTRANMSETIDAIQTRLSPGHIAQQAKDTVREATIGKAQDVASNAGDTTKGFGARILDTIRENPVPAALAGVGLGWLVMSARQRNSNRTSYSGDRYGQRGYRPAYDSDYTYDRTGTYSYQPDQYGTSTGRRVMNQAQDKAGQAANQVQGAAGQIADQAQQTAGQVAGQVQDTATRVAGQAQYTAQRAQSGFQQTLDERPLAVGAAAVALGVAVGLAVPSTDKENELMGETRDNLVDRVQQQAQDTAQKVQDVAEQAAGAAKDTAQQEAQDQGLTQ